MLENTILQKTTLLEFDVSRQPYRPYLTFIIKNRKCEKCSKAILMTLGNLYPFKGFMCLIQCVTNCHTLSQKVTTDFILGMSDREVISVAKKFSRHQKNKLKA